MKILKTSLLALLPTLLVCLCTLPQAVAIELGSENLRLSGFGTLGLVNGGDEVLGFRKNLSQEGVFDGDWSFKTDSLIGLQLDATISDKLSGGVQVVGKERPENSLEDSIEWAFLRYQSSPDLVVRAGRMAADLFMLSDYRNVGFAYIWAHTPTEFYGVLALDYYEGMDVTYSRKISNGILHGRIFAGTGAVDVTTQIGSSGVELDRYFGANLSWESQTLTYRAGVLRSRINDSFKELDPLIDALAAVPAEQWPQAAGLSEELVANGEYTNYYSLGAAYDSGPWVAQGEFGYIDSDFEAAFPDLYSGYLSVGRRFGAVTAYAVGAFARNAKDTLEVPPPPGNDPLLQGLAFGTQLFFDYFGIDQQGLSVGMRWDLGHSSALKLQWDHTRIEGFGSFLWDQRSTIEQERSIDTFSINLNFVF